MVKKNILDASSDVEKAVTHTLFLVFPASSGEYVPVLVDHGDELPCRGQFYLHHGLQRRIRITLAHDSTGDLRWKDVRELVVGRIRSAPESDLDDDLDGSVLSLGLFPGEYLDAGGQQVAPPHALSSTSSLQTPSDGAASNASSASSGTGYVHSRRTLWWCYFNCCC